MDVYSLKQTIAANFSRRILADVLDELVDQIPVPFDGESKTDKVQASLREISHLYRAGLSRATLLLRSDWDDPVNRCAYVFLYLLQHCHLVYFALDNKRLDILGSWRQMYHLKVCSIGGGPGSDLVGLTSFLWGNSCFPSSLECLVLDLHTKWEDTWKAIYRCIPETFRVTYRRCDLVRDASLSPDERRFIQEADILTFVKSFSAVSAFFRADSIRGRLVRGILRDIKPGCFVLYIDNEYDGDTQFEREFASRVGLTKLSQFRGESPVPSRSNPYTIAKYCRLFDFNPMRSCKVNIQLFCNGPPATYTYESSRAFEMRSTNWPYDRELNKPRRRVTRSAHETFHPRKSNSFLRNVSVCCGYTVFALLFIVTLIAAVYENNKHH